MKRAPEFDLRFASDDDLRLMTSLGIGCVLRLGSRPYQRGDDDTFNMAVSAVKNASDEMKARGIF